VTPSTHPEASRDRDGEAPRPGPAALDELAGALAARHAELRGAKERLEADLFALRQDVEPELVERGQEETIARTLETLDDRERAELEAIERALARVAEGRYGTCFRCFRPIAVQRLRALPWAETCVECAPARERRTR